MTAPDAIRLPRPDFLVASPRGDLAFTPDMSGAPLDGCTLSTTYGEYFSGLAAFCRGEGAGALLAAAARAAGRPLDAGEITGLAVKAQKHGALYHPASIEVRFSGGAAVVGANVATSPHGWAALGRERDTLQRLADRIPDAGFPRPLHFFEGDRLDILLVEWFSGFHEFHATADGQVAVWDYEGGGIRRLKPEAARDIYRQAARLLALGYDPDTGGRIWPWRHAAGDFVVRPDGGGLDVRCITARGHLPPHVGGGAAGLAHFLLTTTLLMRLDRTDGVGERVFLPPWCLDAALSGLLEGLSPPPGAASGRADPVAALRGQGPGAWRAMLESDEDLCADADAEFLFSRLDGHLADIAAALG